VPEHQALPGRKTRKLYIGIGVAVLLVIFVLFLVFSFTSLESLLSARLSRALPKSESCVVSLYSRPPLKIWLGEIDYLHLRASGSRDFTVALKELDVVCRDIRFDIFRLSRHDLSMIKAVNMTGTASVDQASLSEYLNSRLPPPWWLDVSLQDDTIQLTVKAGLVKSLNFTIRGDLTVQDGTRLSLKISELSQRSLSVKREYTDLVLKALNPVMDLKDINLAGKLLKKLPDEERKLWTVSIDDVELRQGLMTLRFSAARSRQ